MKQKIKTLLRGNKYIEILSYLLQNNLLKNILNTSGDGSFDKSIDGMYEHSKLIADQYADNYNGRLKDKVLLEIGTGYTRITMLYLIKEYGVSKVYCYDRFNCLQEDENKIINTYKLGQYLDKIEYIYGTNDEINKNIKDKSIDYIVSNAVLEHVDDLPLLFTNLKSVLKIDGQMYHKVDLRCHNRFKINGELYFHTFGDKFWNMMGGNIGQPNRKLLKDYIKLFDTYNLKCEISVFEEFSKEDLEKAQTYLIVENISDYKVAVAEFKLCIK